MFGSVTTSASTKVRIVFQDGDHHGVVYGYIEDDKDENFITFRTEAGKEMKIGKRFIHKIEAVGVN